MRIHKWLMGFILLGYMPITWGQHVDDCYSCGDYFCNMRYHVYTDYLYWNTFRSGIGVQIVDPEEEEDIFLEPDYSSGYRVGARVLWNCMDLGVRYTSYDATTTHFLVVEMDTPALLQQDGPDNTRYRVDFQTVDIELGYLFCFNCGNNFLRPFIGAKLAWIDEKVRFLEGTVFFRNDLDDRGYGPYVGAEGKIGFFNFCNTAVGLRGRGSFGLLNGSQQFSGEGDNDPASTFAEESHLITLVEIFAGLDLSYCDFSCFDLNLQIGYELQYYIRDVVLYPKATVLVYDNIGFGGLVVRLGAYF